MMLGFFFRSSQEMLNYSLKPSYEYQVRIFGDHFNFTAALVLLQGRRNSLCTVTVIAKLT